MTWRISYRTFRHCNNRPWLNISPTQSKALESKKILFRDSAKFSDQAAINILSSWHENESKTVGSSSTNSSLQMGLFHLRDYTARPTLAKNILGVRSEVSKPTKKYPYVSHGTHLDPAVFHQLSLQETSCSKTKRETFHPKLTPRMFHWESADYDKMAVRFPRPSSKGTSFQNSVREYLDQHCHDSRVSDASLRQLLASVEMSSDEFLVELREDERFNELAKSLSEHCQHFETESFIKIMALLARVQIRTANPILRLFEMECLKRCAVWDIDTALLVSDAWRLIGLPVRQLNSKIFACIQHQSNDLTKCQAVQLVHLAGENRYAPSELLEKVQDLISQKYMGVLSLAELGAICQGFFKSQTNLPTLFMQSLSEKLQSELSLDCIHSFYLVGILKSFRQAYFGDGKLFCQVGDAIAPRLHTYPISAVMHVLLTFATLHIYHKPLLEAVAEELIARASECRCKDVSKLLWSFATLRHYPKDDARFFESLLARMVELLDEFEDFPVFLVSGLLSLAYFDMYPSELLDVVFSERFLTKIKEYAHLGNIDAVRDLFVLHSSVSIDCPEYENNSLVKGFITSRPITPGFFGHLSYEISHHPIMRQVSSMLVSVLGGKKYIRMGFILPHMKTADIVIVLDENGCPKPIQQDDFQPLPSASLHKDRPLISLDQSLIANLTRRGGTVSTTDIGIKEVTTFNVSTRERTGQNMFQGVGLSQLETADVDSSAVVRNSCQRWHDERNTDGLGMSDRLEVPKPLPTGRPFRETRIAILIWTRNCFHFNGTELLGLHAMKKRQLEKLGYKTVDIPFFEWDRLSGHKAQKAYIHRKIFPGLR